MEKEEAKRNPFVALVLAILSPGLGQIYNGELKRGLSFYFFMSIVFLYLFKALGVYQSFLVMVGVLFVIVAIQIYFIVNAFTTAKQLREYRLRGYNKWYVYVAIVLLTTILYNLQIALFPYRWQVGTQTFKISTPSMEPTILVGDNIVADFSISEKSIVIGDLVVFKGLEDENQFYISRIAALPGDRFSMQDDFLILNGQKRRVEKAMNISSNDPSNSEMTIYKEILPGGKAISIYKSVKFDSTIANRGEIVIPKDSVMLISDNRDNALDSRYLGLIPLKNISGKILYSFWGKNKSRIGVDFTKK